MFFRLGLDVVGEVVRFFQMWMPTNRLVRWIYADRGVPCGLPIALVLVPVYYALGHVAEDLAATDGSDWWWVMFAWALVNCLKFLSVGLRTPFVWAIRRARRAIDGRRVRRRRAPSSHL